ncbi:(S)-benzoin forming benzil reductase [Patescibacteria group bacterium]|nr:(S)-benzoin forming benzil reductase [Patescibacteria group bacterium]
MTNYIIVTGTSRGLGEAIVMNLLQKGNHLFCISRTKNEKLVQAAKEKNIPLEYFEHDLSDPKKTEELFEKIFKSIDFENASAISLFNNAGVLQPISPIDKYKTADVTTNIHVNLIAPILSTSIFIKHTKDLDIEKRIINISSGAAKNAYYGWSAYCASKAGVNIFSRSVALEQAQRKYPVTIFSFAPGVIDTEMQREIRKSNKDDFVDLQRFIEFKENGVLMSPDFVAKKVITLLTSDQYNNGEFIDIDNME